MPFTHRTTVRRSAAQHLSHEIRDPPVLFQAQELTTDTKRGLGVQVLPFYLREIDLDQAVSQKHEDHPAGDQGQGSRLATTLSGAVQGASGERSALRQDVPQGKGERGSGRRGKGEGKGESSFQGGDLRRDSEIRPCDHRAAYLAAEPAGSRPFTV